MKGEKVLESLDQTYPRRGSLIRGIAVEEQFIYEIISLCLGNTLTDLDEVRKIRGIQGTKEKTTSGLSSFDRPEKLLIANSPLR
jgi:hypothetical protein